jgi:hypothetical protein
MSTSQWAWQDGRNPYRSTAFQVLALDVNLRGRAAIRAHIKTRRQRVHNAPERFLLFGKALTEADINEAEQRVQDPAARLLDELCTHRPPAGPDTPAEAHRTELSAITAELETLAPQNGVAPVTVNTAELARLIPPARPRTFDPLWTFNANR